MWFQTMMKILLADAKMRLDRKNETPSVYLIQQKKKTTNKFVWRQSQSALCQTTHVVVLVLIDYPAQKKH